MTDKTTTLADLKDVVARFIAERDWRRFHDPKNLSMSIAIEAAELMEHFQWLRTDDLPAWPADPADRERVADEMADVLAFLLSLANVLDVDLASALRMKMEKNARKYPAAAFKGRFRRSSEHVPHDNP